MSRRRACHDKYFYHNRTNIHIFDMNIEVRPSGNFHSDELIKPLKTVFPFLFYLDYISFRQAVHLGPEMTFMRDFRFLYSITLLGKSPNTPNNIRTPF